jgi:hypothetical protein
MPKVKINAKSARLQFHPCEPRFIRKVCHSSCCDAPREPQGCRVTIHPMEQGKMEDYGYEVINGYLQSRPETKGCPAKTGNYLCSLHPIDKPFGCFIDPFMFRGTSLIISNRYKFLRCYNKDEKWGENALPAYQAHRASLVMMFGIQEAASITTHLDVGGGDTWAEMDEKMYSILCDREVSLYS